MRCRLMAVLAMSLPLALCAQESGRVVVPVIALKDQYDKPHDVKEFRGHVAVLIYGDKSSASGNSELGAKLHVHFHPAAKGKSAAEAQKAPVKPVAGAPAGARSPDVKTVPVACYKTTSPAIQDTMRVVVRLNAGGVPVWLDFNGTMSANFPYKDGVPNVVVLDAQGRYRYAAAGQPTAEGVERLINFIEQLRKEAMAP
jgi:hypothetical protein